LPVSAASSNSVIGKGPAGFGLRRLLVDDSDSPKAELARGERKSLQTDRVILALGPEDEQRDVREIYDSFALRLKLEGEIASELNLKKVKTDLGREWTRGTVHQILTNPNTSVRMSTIAGRSN
jgi:hypothetical protein